MLQEKLMQMKQRMQSNRGDSNSTSQILWIALTVVLVLSVGAVLFKSISDKGDEVSDLIKDSNNIFKQAPQGP